MNIITTVGIRSLRSSSAIFWWKSLFALMRVLTGPITFRCINVLLTIRESCTFAIMSWMCWKTNIFCWLPQWPLEVIVTLKYCWPPWSISPWLTISHYGECLFQPEPSLNHNPYPKPNLYPLTPLTLALTLTLTIFVSQINIRLQMGFGLMGGHGWGSLYFGEHYSFF